MAIGTSPSRGPINTFASQHTDDVVLLVSGDGRVLHANSNACHSLGIAAAEIGTWRADKILPDFAKLAVAKRLPLTFDTASNDDGIDVEFQDATGRKKLLQTSVYSALDDDAIIIVAHPRVGSWRQSPAPRPIAELKQAALDSLPDEIAVINRDGDIVVSNAAWSGLVSSQRGSPRVKALMALGFYRAAIDAASEENEGSLLVYCQALANCLAGKLNSFSQEWEHADGLGWTRVQVLPCKQFPDEFVLTRQDISAEKAVQARLRSAQELLRTTLTAAAIGVWQLDLATGMLETHTDALARLGIAVPTGAMPYTDWLERIHPDDRAAVLRRLENFQAGNRNQPIIEYRVRDGQDDWAWLSSEGIQSVEPNKVCGIIRDITAGKQADLATSTTLQRLELAISSNGIGIWDLDVVDGKLFCSREACVLHDVAFSPGPTLEQFMSTVLPDDCERLRAQIAAAIASGTEFTAGYRVRHANRTSHWIEACVTAVRAPDGQPIRLLATIADKSRQIEHEENRLQIERLVAIGQLAAGVAHEINTPAHYVGSNLRFIDEGLTQITTLMAQWKGNDHLTADDVRHDMSKTDIDFLLKEAPSAIKQSLDGMERISTIVRSMADFAGLPASPLPTDLNAFICQSVDLVAGHWQEIADIALDLAPDKPGCLVSQTDFGQVIIELLSNAARAIAPTTLEDGQRGRIAIATRQVDKQVEISVEDNGCGMTDDVRVRAFEPFFTTRPLGTGLGHGLPKVQSFVIRHGGTINIESRPGTGTCVLIRLPLLLPN